LTPGDTVKVGDTLLPWESYFQVLPAPHPKGKRTKNLSMLGIIITVVLFIALIVVVFLWQQAKDNTEKAMQKNEVLSAQIDSLAAAKTNIQLRYIGNDQELRGSVERADSAINKQKKDLQKKENELSKQKAENEKARRDISAKIETISELQGTDKQKNEAIKRLNDSLKNEKENNAMLQANLHAKEQRIKVLSDSLKTVDIGTKERKEKDESLIKDLKKQNKELQGMLDSQQQTIRSIQEEQERLKRTR
jgi:chromosome segregation ATPase